MSETITKPEEVAAVGKLIKNGKGYLISITKDYADDLQRISSKRVLVNIKPLV